MASSLLWFLVSANILSIAGAQDIKNAPRGSLDIRDVIPSDMLNVYQDYELLHLEEHEDEDTIFISKRETKTPAKKTKECDDCSWFTPWDKETDSVLKRDILDDRNEKDANVTTHRLEARKTDKDVEDLCGFYGLPGVDALSFGPYIWPTNDEMLTAGSAKVYDFQPYDEPDNKEYYSLKLITGFQGRGGSSKGVSVEHILEWQVLLDFIRQNKDRCEFFSKYFQAEVDIDTKLKVGGKDEEIKGKARAIDWVAWQYPGNGKNGFANKFKDEFVNLHDDVNTRKMVLWSEPEHGQKKKQLVKDTKLKGWIAGYHWPPSQPAPPPPNSNKKPKLTPSYKKTKADKNQGYCEAVVAFRDLIGVYKYHTLPDIQKILTAQIDRIGAALKYLEEGPLKTAKHKDNSDPSDPDKTFVYKPMPTTLEAQWNAYIKAKYKRVIGDLETTLDDLETKLKSVKTSIKRSLSPVEKRGGGNTRSDLCGEEADNTAMKKRIDLVIAEYNSVKGKWTAPT